jgi:hypothetical protein
MPFDLSILPSAPRDRFEVYRLFDGLAIEGKEGSDAGKTRVPLVKTFLLEHVSGRDGNRPKPLPEIWRGLHATPAQVDESFFSITGTVKDGSGKTQEAVTGYVEQYDERFFAYHTVEDSQSARQRVRKWVTRSPDLDSTWFSSPLLKGLWDEYISHRDDHRYTKLVFRHESVYDLHEDTADDSSDEDDESPDSDDFSGEHPEPERRRIHSEMGDCVSRLRDSLDGLRRSYSPLHALYSVRIPSTMQRGGHDLYQHGQITNRSNSFTDHRNHARFLWRLYKGVLEDTEDSAWGSAGPSTKPTVGWQGVPLIVKFGEPLSRATFDNFISKAFRKGNRFNLWGEPQRLGPTKIHLYGADRHLWQPLNLEITDQRLVAILPRGTCGNTFHRLVANLQQWVCPKIEAWIGARRFDSFLTAKNISPPAHET